MFYLINFIIKRRLLPCRPSAGLIENLLQYYLGFFIQEIKLRRYSITRNVILTNINKNIKYFHSKLNF